MANLQIRITDDLRDKAKEVAENMGLDLTTAVKIFLHQMVRENSLPFKPSADPFYSEVNLARLRESMSQLHAGRVSRHEVVDE